MKFKTATVGGFCLSFLGSCVIIIGEFKKLDSGLSQAYFIRCESIVKLMLSVLFVSLTSPTLFVVGELLVIKNGKPESHRINDKVI